MSSPHTPGSVTTGHPATWTARPSSRRAFLTAVLGLGASGALAAGLTGCSKDAGSVAAQAQAGDNKGYVAGDGTIESLSADKRGAPVALTGRTVDGGSWSMAEQGKGKVVVVNVWGAWCPPCQAETPALIQAYGELTKAHPEVTFVGVAIKEPSANSLALMQSMKVPYPSISNDDSGGTPLLSLQGKASATPSTLVLDTQGRIAARILGPADAGTLRALVSDVLAS